MGNRTPYGEDAGEADRAQASRLSTDYTWTLELKHKLINSGDTSLNLQGSISGPVLHAIEPFPSRHQTESKSCTEFGIDNENLCTSRLCSAGSTDQVQITVYLFQSYFEPIYFRNTEMANKS